MKVLVFSDLHLEFGKPFTAGPPSDVDAIVCAGDVLDKGRRAEHRVAIQLRGAGAPGDFRGRKPRVLP